jgi:hypothetical protein
VANNGLPDGFKLKKECHKMGESSLLHDWTNLLGSLATIAIIVLAVGVMLGIVKSGDALKHIGAIVGILVGLTMLPSILASAWSAMAFWQQLCLAVIGVGALLCLLPRRRTQKRRGD